MRTVSNVILYVSSSRSVAVGKDILRETFQHV